MCAMRTAPIGPLNGMPETMRAAEAPLMDAMSCGFSRSAPRIVAMTWTSLRKPSGNDGRSGRSVRRQVRIACSPGRPSRRKNEPGILPAAYIRSSTSTVRGKKSMPSRGLLVTTVDSSVVSPSCTSTAPSASWASRPVSSDMTRPASLTGPETRIASEDDAIWELPCCGGEPRRFPVVRVRTAHAQRAGSGPWRLTTDDDVADLFARTILAKRGADVRSSSLLVLPAKAELGDECPIPLDVVASEVVEQPPTATDEHQQPTARVMVLLVDLQVLREVVDPLGEDRHLDLGRAGVGLVEAVLLDGCGLVGHAVARALLRGWSADDCRRTQRVPGTGPRDPPGSGSVRDCGE